MSQRIPNVLYYISFSDGGITRYSREVMNASVDDVKYDVLCPPSTLGFSDGIEVFSSLESLNASSSHGSRFRFLRSQILNPKRLLGFAKSHYPDVIHFGNINHVSYPFWRRKLRTLGIPIVATVHDVRRRVPIVSRSFDDWALRLFYRDASALFVHGESQRSALISFADVNPDVIHVVPHGMYQYPVSSRIKDVRSDFGIPESSLVGLQFGYLREEKNTKDLVRAIALTKDSHLIVAGSPLRKGRNTLESLVRFAEKLGVGARVHVVEGFIPEDEVQTYFDAADWVALTYASDFTSPSGVLASAVYFRKPVLVAGAPLLQEIVARFGIGEILTRWSPPAVADALEKFPSINVGFWASGFERYEQHSTWLENALITSRVYRGFIT